MPAGTHDIKVFTPGRSRQFKIFITCNGDVDMINMNVVQFYPSAVAFSSKIKLVCTNSTGTYYIPAAIYR